MTRAILRAWCLTLLTASALLLIYLFSHSLPALAALCGLALFLLSAQALAALSRKKLMFSLSLPTTGEKNTQLTGRIVCKRNTRLPLGTVFCTLTLQNDLTGETASLCVPLSGQEAAFSFQALHCGRIRVRIARAHLTGLVPLLPLPAAAGREAKLTVLPETFAPEVHLRIPQAQVADSTDYAPDRRGNDPTEPYQLRDYAPGDSLRQIHWKLSGKLDHLVVREAGAPVLRTLLILWVKHGDAASLDAQAEVVFSVCQSLCDQQQPFCLGWTEAGGLQLREIGSMEEGLAQLPALLRAGAAELTLTGDMQTHGGSGFGKILLISDGIPEAFEVFSGAAEPSLLLCTTTPIPTELPAVFFTPENYLTALRHLEFT